MEPVIIKKGKREYAFYSDRIEVTKKNKTIGVIRHDEIKKISYNPKFGFKDLLHYILLGIPHGKNAFNIVLKSKKRYEDEICLPISNDEFERVKTTFEIPIKLI